MTRFRVVFRYLWFLGVLATVYQQVGAEEPKSIDVEFYDQPGLLPYTATSIREIPQHESVIPVNPPILVYQRAEKPGDTIQLIRGRNTPEAIDDPSIVTYLDLSNDRAIDDNPVPITITSMSLAPDSEFGRPVVLLGGYKNDSSFIGKMYPGLDSIEWLFLATGEDQTGNGVWEGPVSWTASLDYDYDGRVESFYKAHAARDLYPREMFCLESEGLDIEWSLPLAPGLMKGRLFACGDSADPAVIFTSYNMKQGVTQGQFSDSWAYLTIVDASGTVRFNRVISAEHGGIDITPTARPDEFVVAHTIPWRQPDDTLDFPPAGNYITRFRTDGTILSTGEIANQVRAMWPSSEFGENDDATWVLSVGGILQRFDSTLRLEAQSGETHLAQYQGITRLPGAKGPVAMFSTTKGPALYSTGFEHLGSFPKSGGPVEILEERPDGSLLMLAVGGSSSVVYRVQRTSTWSYIQTLAWHYQYHLLAAAFLLLMGLVVINHRRWKTAQRLRRREADLRAFIEASPDVILHVSSDGVVFDYRVTDSSRLPLPPEEFLGKPIDRVLSPEAARVARAKLHQALDTGQMQTMEYLLDGNGKHMYLEARVAAVSDREGVVVLRDITDRVEASNLLQTSERRYRLLFQGVRDAIISADCQTGRIVEANDAAEILTGRSRDELIGLSQHELHPDPEKSRASFNDHVAKGGVEVPHQSVLKRLDGARVPVEVTTSIIEIDGRRVIQSVFRDISSRMEAEEALRRSEERFRTLVANIPAVIYRCRVDETFSAEYVSEEVLSLTGYPAGDFIDDKVRNFSSIVHPDDRERTVDIISRAIDNREPYFAEFRLIHREGEIRWLSDRGQAIYDSDGNPMYIDGAVFDITEQKLADEALREQEEKMRAQYRGIPMPTYTFQHAGNDFILTDYNEAAITATDGGIATLVGSSARKLFKNRPDIIRAFKSCLRQKSIVTRESEYTYITTGRRELLSVHFVYVPPDIVMVHTEDVTTRRRAEELIATRLRYEKGLADCSRELLSSPVGPEALDAALRHLLEASETTHAVVFENYEDSRRGLCFRPTNEACQESYAPFMQNDVFLNGLPYDPEFTAYKDLLAANQPAGDSVDEMPVDAAQIVEPEGVRSFLVLPLFVGGKWRGFLGFNDAVRKRTWEDQDVRLLRTAADIISSYLEMVHTYSQLEEERDFTQSILQTANSLIVCIDEDRRITVFNEELERVTGYKREEVLGKEWHKYFLPKRYHHQGLETWPQWVRQHPADRYERELLTRSGEERMILWSNSMMINPRTGKVTAIAIGHDITDRRKAQQALIQNERKYRAIMQQSKDNIYLMDIPTGRILEANPSLQRLLGYSAEEMQELTCFDFIDHDPTEVSGNIQQVVDGTLTFIPERFYRTKDGQRIPVEITLNTLDYDEQSALCVVSRDISERKRIEESIRQQEEKYRLLVENVRAAIALVDADGKFLFCNENAARATGRTTDQLIGMTQWEVFPREVADRQVGAVRRVIAENQELLQESQVYLRGEWRWFYTNIQPYRDATGRTTAALVIAHDITAARQAQEALSESEQRFRELADLLPQTIFEADTTGKLLYTNRHGFESTGYTPEDLERGIDVSELFLEEDRPAMQANFARRLRGETADRHEYTHVRKDGSTFPVLIYSSPIRRDRKVTGLRGVVIDITDLKRAEDRVRQLNQARYRQMKEMAGGVSHEINNSLYPAVLSLERLRGLLDDADVKDVERTEHLLKMTEKAVRRAITLTETVTYYSRLEMQADIEPVSFSALAEEVLDNNRHDLEDLAVCVETEFDDSVVLGMRKTHAFSMLNNLIVNSVDALAESRDRKLHIRAARDNGRVRIEVADTGPGIPFEVYDQIFEPFFTTKPNRGTGLGLAVVRKIVDIYSGEIEVDSNLDSGTRFVILLDSHEQA